MITTVSLSFAGRDPALVLSKVARHYALNPETEILEAVREDIRLAQSGDGLEAASKEVPENRWKVHIVPSEDFKQEEVWPTERDATPRYKLLPDRAAILLREIPQREFGFDAVMVFRRKEHHCFLLQDGTLTEAPVKLTRLPPNRTFAYAFAEFKAGA